MTLLPLVAVLAVLAFLSFYRFSIETQTHKLTVNTLQRPLNDTECDYMTTLPAMGVTISDDAEISSAHESLLMIELVTETWSNDGKSRTITFTEEGQALARLMRADS
tara:strand:+ start:21481 stop:21801 length:321 start_codon:yes stop_codon:yes gene_type:complete